MTTSLLEIHDLNISFTRYDKGLRQMDMPMIRNLSMTIDPGEIVAVVGASGSGKSLLAHAILGILPRNAKWNGSLTFDGQSLTPKLIKKLRGREIAIVPQSVDFLDPLMRVGMQVRQAVRVGDPVEEQIKAFRKMRLGPKAAKRYPFQLSGGMARRVLVSIASVSGARLLIADEPTPGLDEGVVQETLNMFRQFADAGTAVVFITHDLEAALSIADRVAVFYSGTVLEMAEAADFTGKGERLRHPYTQALWRALPQNDFAVPEEIDYAMAAAAREGQLI
ncbi:oligopeptide/dipeptide ABC transporter ATP-binding protein [Paenibacillus sp. TCA20]|uniref:ATP-binding cassette domain-containing protein n=1 Tax=unclassified Paenibacillus TaxID=185978 RepID=UPI0004D70E61|nr:MULTISPECIES: ABC transporter ATP-binding protein [unclassified Paenibacillus]OMC72366.1 peptide ABC transporter ATP-binding protein [Paenibacillus sp. FSL H7-0326]GAK41740.1 oligopeptide/dipeptide ABC transporter ATP-binding protein [Paenibacillus sp. TCA20]